MTSTTTVSQIGLSQTTNPRIVKAAKEMEASFLAEMLKATGAGKPRSSFGGGAGEDHFSSLLVQEFANETVRAGGIGLAELIYRSISEKGEAS